MMEHNFPESTVRGEDLPTYEDYMEQEREKKRQERIEKMKESESKECYLMYYYKDEMKIQEGLLTPSGGHVWSDGVRGYGIFRENGSRNYKCKVPLVPFEVKRNKIICFNEKDIPKAKEVLASTRQSNQRARDSKNKTLAVTRTSVREVADELFEQYAEDPHIVAMANRLLKIIQE